MEENKSWRQLLQLQLLLIRSREENAELIAQIEKLQTVAQDLRAKQSSAASVADQDDEIILISTQLHAEEVEIGKLKLAKDQAEARKRELITDLKSVQDIIRKVKCDKERFENSIIKFQEKIESTRKRITIMIQEREKTVSSIQSFRLKVEELRNILEKLTRDINSEKSRCDTLKIRQTKLKAIQDRLVSEQLDLEQKTDKLQQEMQAVRLKVQESRKTRKMKFIELRSSLQEHNRLNVQITRMKRRGK